MSDASENLGFVPNVSAKEHVSRVLEDSMPASRMDLPAIIAIVALFFTIAGTGIGLAAFIQAGHAELRADLRELRDGQTEILKDVGQLGERVAVVETLVSEIDADISGIETRIVGIEDQSKEHLQLHLLAVGKQFPQTEGGAVMVPSADN